MELGSVAPDFTLPTNTGDPFVLSDNLGRIVVIYFYPKAGSSSCAKQAVAFQDLQSAFDTAGALVIGISKDSIKKLQNFVYKQGLNFPLASDENTDVCERYGVWKEKKMYGKTYMGIERSTFIVDTQGNLARIWQGVKVPGHAEEVLEAVKQVRGS